MRNRKHRGVALVTAIWIMVVLLILAGGFAAMINSETQVASNFGNQTRARWAAWSGIRQAMLMVESVAAEPYTALTDDQRLLASPDATGTLYDTVSPEETAWQVQIDDEAGKLNLNTATPEMLALFFPEDVAIAIVDWRDEDDTPGTISAGEDSTGAEGAEDDYYTTLTPPYHCKNAPFTTVGELLLVRGVTREMLEAPITEGGPALEELLTVSSTDDNTDMQGEARLNITSATEEAWTDRCGDVLTEEEISAIMRQQSSFDSPADLLSVSGLARDTVARIYDRLTATTDTARPGLININTAPLEVLVALPGMEEATAADIIAYRDDQGPFTDVGQLLGLESISDTTFSDIADLMTARSHIFHVRATGQTANGIEKSITCLLRVDGDATRMMYWRE